MQSSDLPCPSSARESASGLFDATLDQPINPVSQRIVLPRDFIAKLPKLGTHAAKVRPQAAKVGLHSPKKPNHDAKAGKPTQGGHHQIKPGNQFRCHTSSMSQGRILVPT